MQPYNLNELKIEDHNSCRTVSLRDFSAQTDQIDVVFKNIEARLVTEISRADAVVGCVAWLTSIPVLEALATKTAVSIVVQKEDFLRPDNCGPSKARLHQLYAGLPESYRMLFSPASNLSVGECPGLQGVRCIGNHNSVKSPSHPRCHHKFVVFLRGTGEWKAREEPQPFSPYAVWTGSFNFTRNATLSFENAVIIRTREVVNAFYEEWGQVLALSEPLDWESPWVEPEWRIGT